jgi:hypothetical protein
MFSFLAVEGLSITVLSLFAVIVIVTKKARAFAGHKEIARDVKEIAADFHGQVSRAGDDLVVSANRNSVPTILQFSHSENITAFKIQCNAPVNFRLLLARKGRRFAGEGDLQRLDNPRLDNFLVCYTSDAVPARIFLGFPAVREQLKKLSWSSGMLLRFSGGKVELTEPAIPLNLAGHVFNQCDALGILAEECRKMPNAGQVVIDRIPDSKQAWGLRASLAVGVFASLGIVLSMNANVKGATLEISQSGVGLEAGDSKIIPDVKNWRLGRDEDLNTSFIAWIDPRGEGSHSRFSLAADGKHESDDNAYILTSDKNSNIKRVVWIAHQRLVYDYVGTLVGIVRIPRDEMEHMRWSEAGTPQELPDGDGLLVVREYGSPNGASIFFLHAGVLCSGVPADYRSLSLK